MAPALIIALSILTGYLLGCLSPAWILGRLLKGIDLREVNHRSAGARNAWATLGLWPALVTVVIDTSKGAGAVLLARVVFGLPEALVVVPAVAAIAGHIAPFWLRFRGGSGTATAVGILMYLLALGIFQGRFLPDSFAMLLAVTLLAFLASRSGEVTGMVSSLFMLVLAPIELGITSAGVLAAAIAAFILVSVTRDAIRLGVLRLERKVELKPWRLVARPFALLFIPIDRLWGRRVLLLVIGSVALLFIGIDFYRIVTRRRIAQMYKSGEERRFSSMTFFLVSVFLGFLVFPDAVPYLPLAFSTVGDLFGKLFGLRYGRTPLYKAKTLQGSLGFLAGALLTGWILYRLVPMPLVFVLAGAPFAATVELFSELLDDNFSVSLLTGGFLAALRYFLRV